jgi:O-antigen ligase
MNFLTKENPDRWHQLAWWLCVVTLPWHAWANNISLILLTILWLADGDFKLKWQRLKAAKWILPFLLYYLILLIGMFYTPDVDRGLVMLDKKIIFLAFPIIIASGRILNRKFFGFLKQSFVYSCIAIVLVCLVLATNSFFHRGPIENFDIRTNEHFMLFHPEVSPAWPYFSYIQLAHGVGIHPGYLSMFLVFCMVILFTENYQTRKERIIHSILGIAIVCSLVLLASRTATLAFICSIIYIVVKKIQEKQFKIYVPIVLSSILLVFLLWLVPVAKFRVIEEPMTTKYKADTTVTDWNSVSYRLLEWRGGWSVIKANWFAGVGTGGNGKAMALFYEHYSRNTAGFDFNAHNEYMQVWTESGLPGLFTFLLCFIVGLFPLRSDLSYGSFIIIFGVMCLTESMGEWQKGIAFFCLFQSLFLGTEREKV